MAKAKSETKSVTVKPTAVKEQAARKPVVKESEKPMFLKSNGRRLKPAKKKIPLKKKVAPKLLKKVVVQKPVEPVKEVDTAKAVAFAMSIALARKRAVAQADSAGDGDSIRLSRRPTTRSQGKSTEKFPEADLREFRRRLLEARATATSGVDAMKATSFNASDEREADGGDGTDQMLKLQALGQMGNIKRTLQRIDEALHRIDEGTYGVCTMCGQLIRKPRLLNQPFVLTCMECQSEMEKTR